MESNNSNGQYTPNDTRLNAISYLWNCLSYYTREPNTTEQELLYDTKSMFNELDVLPEMFDVCTKLQKLGHEPVSSTGYKQELIRIMSEAMEVLQAAPN